MFTCNLFSHVRNKTNNLVKFKHKANHWSVLVKKNHPVDKALEHFDDFYKQVFTYDWPAIREGLLGKQKYVAVVNNYSDSDQTSENLENQGAMNVRRLFHLEKQYVQEKLVKSKRLQKLHKSWKMDKEMDGSVSSEQNIVPDDTIESKSIDTSHQLSLESNLKSAEIDVERLIDSRNSLSSEVLQEFIPATKIKGKEDFVPESKYYEYYQNDSKFKIKIEMEYDLHFPDHLNVYTFESGNHSDYGSPKRGSTGVLDYYLMDGGSILPILALDLEPGNRVFDMCAAPGGKSLLALQTHYPDYILCNDVSKSRVHRIFSVYKQYLYDLEKRFLSTGKLKVSTSDGREASDKDFDRILVDVPCTTDRHSLFENDNNIFKPARIKERLQLPELQSELLVTALKLVKPGGIVVYSTCTLSPIQNDGVVHMALKQIWEETDMEIVVSDLNPALLQIRSLYKLANPKLLKYGHLIIPTLSQNFGPTYFCKLKKTK